MQSSTPALTQAIKDSIQMTQTRSVLSTPRTNTPIDATRRHLLTIAAGGAIAAAIPTAGLTAAAEPDPIYEAIAACRAA